jgi:hypothetical protein
MKTTTVTTRNVKIEGAIDYEDLVGLLKAKIGVPLRGVSFTLYVDVPGGGDWSNTELDVEEHPVKFVVEWTEKIDS